MNKKKNTAWYVLAAIVIIVMIILVVNMYIGKSDLAKVNTIFEPYFEQYKQIVDAQDFDYGSKAAEPLKFVMITYNYSEKKYKLDSLYSSLPKEMKATSPAEANTVIKVYYEDVLYGAYTDGYNAYQRKIIVSAYDIESGEQLFYREFIGPYPQYEKATSGDRYGAFPNHEVLDFIVSFANPGEAANMEKAENAETATYESICTAIGGALIIIIIVIAVKRRRRRKSMFF